MKFIVGDRVKRIVCVHANNTNIVPGMVGTVRHIDRHHARVLWDGFEHDAEMSAESCDNDRLEWVSAACEPTRALDPDEVIDLTDSKPSNPKDRAATHRVDTSLFPTTAIVFGTLAMTEGDCKYGAYNYRAAGVNVSTYKAALDRHIGKYYDRGEWADPVTKVPHLANALACIAVLIDGHCKGNITDDRPPRMDADLYAWAEGVTKHIHETYKDGPGRFTELKDGNDNGVVPEWLRQK